MEDRMFRFCLALALLGAALVILLGVVVQPDVPTPTAVLLASSQELSGLLEDTLEASSVDLNTATAARLSELAGVGETLSARIVAYREAIGGFTTKEQLLEVRGIGPATYEKIEPFVYVGSGEG